MVTGGYRSVFGWWIGGMGAVPGVTPTFQAAWANGIIAYHGLT